MRPSRVDDGYGWSDWHWYFYDGLKVIAEGTGTADRTFFTLGPGDVGGIIARDDDGTKYWYHYDRLGNVLGVTDANGDVAQVYQLDGFGVLRQAYGSSGYNSTESPVQRYGLTTKERDPDTGLYYFNARWYYPWWGRFLSVSAEPSQQRERIHQPQCGSTAEAGIDPPAGCCKKFARRMFGPVSAASVIFLKPYMTELSDIIFRDHAYINPNVYCPVEYPIPTGEYFFVGFYKGLRSRGGRRSIQTMSVWGVCYGNRCEALIGIKARAGRTILEVHVIITCCKAIVIA